MSVCGELYECGMKRSYRVCFKKGQTCHNNVQKACRKSLRVQSKIYALDVKHDGQSNSGL